MKVFLRTVGETLYGPRWQCELARALEVNDRTVRGWLVASGEIPPRFRPYILTLVRARIDILAAIEVELNQ